MSEYLRVITGLWVAGMSDALATIAHSFCLAELCVEISDTARVCNARVGIKDGGRK